MTQVVNVKVKYIRQDPDGPYDNLKEWCQDERNVYIGRRGIVFVDKERYPKHDSPFANPFKIGQDGTREEVIKKYRRYIKKKVREGEVNIEELRGKKLGCWCKPESCHGDVLLELIG